MLCSQFIFIKVLSDDFADVDVREDLCYHSRPKKAKFERRKTDKRRMSESSARREKRQPIPSGSAGTAPPPPRFPVRVFLFSLGAWACLRRRAAPPLSSLTSSRLTATSGKPVRRVLRMDNDMKKGKHSIKSLPFQWDMKLNSISVLPDIGAIFVADAEFKVIHT